MAISANTVFEVRTTGSNTNGGGFVTGATGTDYSQQDSAQYSGTDLVVDGTTNTKVTSASHSFVAADVGNLLQVTAGASWTTGFYQIVSVASGAATLDRSPAAVTVSGGTYAVGGALATISKSTPAVVAGNTVYIKASGNYNESPSFTTTAGNSPSTINWIGYTTTRGDNGQVTIDAQNTRTQCITINKNFQIFKNFIFTNATTRCIDNTAAISAGTFQNCQLLKGSGSGNLGSDSSTFNAMSVLWLNCFFNGFATNAATRTGGSQFICCEIKNCGAVTTPNFSLIGYFFNCLFWGGAGPAITFGGNGNSYGVFSCTFKGKTSGSGILFNSSNSNCQVVNCIFSSNAAYGIDSPNDPNIYANYNAYYNNTSGQRSSLSAGANDITLTADPFTNASGGDFSLNNVAGGGAACRAVGIPGAFPGGTTTGYLDVGSVQHQSSGGGLIYLSGMCGGME